MAPVTLSPLLKKKVGAPVTLRRLASTRLRCSMLVSQPARTEFGHIVAHPFMPGLGAILGANDLAGIRLSAQHRRDEGVDRHVAHLSIDRLHGAAVGAVGVGEDDNLALTLAEDLFDSILKRPFLPALARPLAKTFIRKVRLLDRIDQAAVEQVARLIIDIEHPVLNHDLPHAGHGRLLDSVRLEAGRLHERILDTLGRCCKDGDGKART